MSDEDRPAAAQPASIATAPHYTWGDGCDGWHLLREPGLSVIEERMPPGTAEVRHLHHDARQLFYVLEGALRIEAAGVVHRVERGAGLHVPPGCAHEVRNDSAADARFLVCSQPPSHGDRVPAPLTDGGPPEAE